MISFYITIVDIDKKRILNIAISIVLQGRATWKVWNSQGVLMEGGVVENSKQCTKWVCVNGVETKGEKDNEESCVFDTYKTYRKKKQADGTENNPKLSKIEK